VYQSHTSCLTGPWFLPKLAQGLNTTTTTTNNNNNNNNNNNVLCFGQGLQIADYHKPLIEATGKELLEEKAEALEVCEQ